MCTIVQGRRRRHIYTRYTPSYPPPTIRLPPRPVTHPPSTTYSPAFAPPPPRYVDDGRKNVFHVPRTARRPVHHQRRPIRGAQLLVDVEHSASAADGSRAPRGRRVDDDDDDEQRPNTARTVVAGSLCRIFTSRRLVECGKAAAAGG